MRKKILFLSAWYPTRYDPMPGLFVKRHAEIMTDTFDVSVLHTFAVESLESPYEIEVRDEDNIFTVRVYYRKVNIKIPGLNLLLKFFRFFRAHRKGWREIQKQFGRPELMHVNILTRVGVYALYLKIIYKIPYVITEHWSRYLPERNLYRGFIKKVITNLVVKNSSAISTISEKLKSAMLRCGIHHKNFCIVNNVVDCNVFKPLNEPPANPIIFSHISCFDDNVKNITGIIRAIHGLTSLRQDFVCFMAGEGEDRKKAENLVAQLGLSKFVKFPGLLEGEALIKVYNQSAFTVLFSNYENMPVVISESLACGKPVIATKVGGISEIINNSNGILIDPGDENALTKAINTMLDTYPIFNSGQIRNYAVHLFSCETVRYQLSELYNFCFPEMK
jgi:L-malate glycosyltransferase